MPGLRSILVGSLLLVAVATTGIAIDTKTASADATDHNCAGVFSSSVAGPGFGAAVTTFAHIQMVDNLGFADCFQTNRNNP
jgi:hypothetical protein